jgi:MFS family permease
MRDAPRDIEVVMDTGDKRKASKNIFFLGLVSFFNDFASEMIYPLLPLFLTSVLGVGAFALGIIEGIAESTASVLKFFSGYVSDRYKRRKPIFAAGYTLSNAVRPLIGIAASWLFVLLLRFADRAGKGIRTAPRDALLADSAGEKRRGFAFGFQRALDHAGAVMGPLAAVLLLPLLDNNLRHLFLLSALPGVVVFFIVFFAVSEVRPKGTATPERITLLSGLRDVDKSFRYYLAVIFIFTLGNSSDAFLLLKAQEAGIAVASIPLLWVALHIVKSLTAIPGGWLSDRVGRKRIIIVGWAVYGIIYVAFALTTENAGIWALFVLYGVYFGLTEGVERAMVADMVRTERLGTAYGLFNLTVGFATLPASLLFGFVWELFGSPPAFLMGAGLALVSSLLLLGVRTKKPTGGEAR